MNTTAVSKQGTWIETVNAVKVQEIERVKKDHQQVLEMWETHFEKLLTFVSSDEIKPDDIQKKIDACTVTVEGKEVKELKLVLDTFSQIPKFKITGMLVYDAFHTFEQTWSMEGYHHQLPERNLKFE